MIRERPSIPDGPRWYLLAMLVHLRVRDLVLIDDLDLPLSPGFNVLTGETGAGKSLVATAIHLLLGRKASPDIVRRGAAEAERKLHLPVERIPVGAAQEKTGDQRITDRGRLADL